MAAEEGREGDTAHGSEHALLGPVPGSHACGARVSEDCAIVQEPAAWRGRCTRQPGARLTSRPRLLEGDTRAPGGDTQCIRDSKERSGAGLPRPEMQEPEKEGTSCLPGLGPQQAAVVTGPEAHVRSKRTTEKSRAFKIKYGCNYCLHLGIFQIDSTGPW